jgi:anthranilate synthase component 1
VIETRTIVADGLTPVRAYAALRQAAGTGQSFLFESVIGGERWGRYSILGYRPRYEAILSPSHRWQFSGDTTGIPHQRISQESDPLKAFAHLLPRNSVAPKSTAEKFARSLIGYFAWDVLPFIAKVNPWPSTSASGTGPVARFMGGSTIVVFDSLEQTVTVASDDRGRLEQALDDLRSDVSLRHLEMPDRSRIPNRVEESTSDGDFEAMVLKAQNFIAAGDAFQIVLARQFRTPGCGRDPFDVYRAMRVINPSPYMYFLDLPPVQGESSRTAVAGASPETLVRVEDATMMVRPIAGTRRRGRNVQEDLAMEKELLNDPKELAEHVMLIDLGRNDVGQVAQVGSVRLEKKMVVERYSHVMHIVSEVQGKVRPDVSTIEAFRAAFPAGTLSGAPKLRAMQIIRELEATPRGIYGGAVGYIADSGDLDFAIAIRTAVHQNDTFTVTAGAGVVEASSPRAEAEETRNKARGVLCAIEAIAPTTKPSEA